MLPIKQKENARVKKYLRLLLEKDAGKEKLDFYLEKNQKARARLLTALLDQPVLEYDLAVKKLHITLPVIRALEEQGVLVMESEQVYRNPVRGGSREAPEITFYTGAAGGGSAVLPGITGQGNVIRICFTESPEAERRKCIWK